MEFIAYGLLVIVLLAALFTRIKPGIHSGDPDTLRTVAQGQLIGFRNRQQGYSWLGIPYAQAPIGKLRWCAPRPTTPWQGTLQALRYGAQPPQFASPAGNFRWSDYGKIRGDEDCLYLNIFAPNTQSPATKQKLPVMLWIYGGGYAAGSASAISYDLSYFAQQHQVIAVSFNYRLGVFGWFYHPDLHNDDASAEDRCGNYGTLDTIQALRWIQENIAAFGGDPERVTIWGESAGAISVISLLLSEQASGLFHAAIAQSPVIHAASLESTHHYHDDPEQAGHRASSRELINQLLIKKGLANDRETAKHRQACMQPQELRELLYSCGAEELLTLFNDEHFMAMYATPRPIGDGYLLPASAWPAIIKERGIVNRVPLIVGSNRDEYKLFMARDEQCYVDLIAGIWPRIRDPQRYERDAHFHSLLWRASAIDEIANALTAHNSEVYTYRWDWRDWPSPLGINLSRLLGAAHATELLFILGGYHSHPRWRFLLGGKRYRIMLEQASQAQQYWAQFAKTGNPNTLPEITWPAWDRNGNTRLLGNCNNQIALGAITVADVQRALTIHPDLNRQKNELIRLYAHLFYCGIADAYWEAEVIPELRDLAPDGDLRRLVEATEAPRLRR